MKLFVQSLVIKVERKDEYTEIKKVTVAYFASKEWVIQRPWCFQQGGKWSEKKKKSGKKAELRYSTLGHTYVDVPLTSGIGSSEYSLIKDLHAGLG